MKRKIYIIVVIILALAIAGILLFKNSSNHSVENVTSKEIKQDSLQAFQSFYNRATQFRLHDEVDSSIMAYEEATRLNPGDEDALYYLGTMYSNARDFEKARQAWEKLIRIDAHNQRAYIQLGNLYFCMTNRKYFNPKKAEFYFQRAKEINKDSMVPNLRLGEITLYLNKTKDALDIFNKLSAKYQDNVEIGFLNGFLFWKMGEEPESLALLKLAFHSAKSENIKLISDVYDRECNLFLYWTNANLSNADDSNISASMPGMFKEFDQYLEMMRDKLNSH